MSITEWRRERLEQAARDGEVVKLTGPRSIATPGETAAPRPQVEDRAPGVSPRMS